MSTTIAKHWPVRGGQGTLHGAEEVLQFLDGLLGTFFLQEMAAIETAPSHR